MFNRNYDYQIDFGKAVDVSQKFKDYKAFFQKAVVDSTLYKYKKIDLRFTKQVVCTK
jgi:cell division protein FtsQ